MSFKIHFSWLVSATFLTMMPATFADENGSAASAKSTSPYLNPVKKRENGFSCEVYSHLLGDVCRGERLASAGVTENISQNSQNVMIVAAGYGVSLYITSQLGRALASEFMVKDKALYYSLATLATELGRGDDEAGQNVLDALLASCTDGSLRALLSAIEIRLADGLTNDLRQIIAKNHGALFALGLGRLAKNFIEKHSDHWIGILNDKYPDIMRIVVRYAPLCLLPAAKSFSPRRVQLMNSPPSLAAKTPLSSPLSISMSRLGVCATRYTYKYLVFSQPSQSKKRSMLSLKILRELQARWSKIVSF